MDVGDATFPAIAASAASPAPVNDSDLSPVGSSEDTRTEVQALLSDDDADQVQEHGFVVSVDDLKLKILKQVEYYFSDENLPTDKYLMSIVKKQKEGFVPIGLVASFRKMKKLSQEHSLIVAALRESSLLVVSSDGKRVKRLHPIPLNEVKDPKLCTVLVENLPEDHSKESLQKIFGKVGYIKNISICDPHALEEPKKGRKTEMLISGKLHALVEYDTMDAAEKAAVTLNNEQDWRNGMRVKLLSRMGKYGHKKTTRGHDAEKNTAFPSSDQVVEHHDRNSKEHHDAIPDEESVEHLPKEKDVQKGRNRGHTRRHKYHGTNGQGHGTNYSSHGIEPSKPPPGPKMPDGTRGFTMGRGRPPIST